MEDTNKEIDSIIENNSAEITSLVETAIPQSKIEKKDSPEKNTNIDKDSEDKKIDFKLDHLNLSKSNIINILEDLRVIKKRFNHIENIIREAERSQYSPSRDLPGVTGVYNGEYMVSSDGVRHEVPKNYAAKSLLVNGDELKMLEQDGKVAFKIVKKVARKKIEGLLSKKDGRYVILSDSGTFNLLKSAVEFRNIKQGEWILAVIPETGSANNFAAIDKVIKKETQKEVKFYDKPVNKQPSSGGNISPKPQNFPVTPKPVLPQTPKPQIQTQQPIRPQPTQDQKPSTPAEQPKSPMPKIQFSDEDLI